MGPRLIGFAAMESPSLFPCPRESRPSRPSTRRFAPGFTLPVCASSSELLRAAPLPCPFGQSSLPGSPPSSRHHPCASTSREGSRGPAPFRPQAFTASRRFSPRSGFEASFILEPRSGMCSPFRGFSLRGALRSRRASLPPCRWHTARSAGSCDPPATSGGLDFEASFHAKARSHRLGVEPDRWPLPSSGCFSSRYPALRMGPRLPRRPPLLTLRSPAFAFAIADERRLQRLTSEGLGASVSRHADLPESFWPDDRNQ